MSDSKTSAVLETMADMDIEKRGDLSSISACARDCLARDPRKVALDEIAGMNEAATRQLWEQMFGPGQMTQAQTAYSAKQQWDQVLAGSSRRDAGPAPTPMAVYSGA